MEIANATDRSLPSSDDFPKIEASWKNQYPDQSVAIGYLEAARAKMIDACVAGIDIYFYQQMGYTNSTLSRKTAEAREKISGYIEEARTYLEKAKSAVK